MMSGEKKIQDETHTSHVLKIKPIPDIQHSRKGTAGGDAIDAITCRPPDGILGPGLGRMLGWHELVASSKDSSHGMLMVEHDAREIAVDAIVDVQHVRPPSRRGILERAPRNDVARQPKGPRHIVPSGFADDAHVRGEVIVQRRTDDRGHQLKGVVAESTPDVERTHVEADQSRLVEDVTRISDRLDEQIRIRRAGTDMEADAHHLQT